MYPTSLLTKSTCILLEKLLKTSSILAVLYIDKGALIFGTAKNAKYIYSDVPGLKLYIEN